MGDEKPLTVTEAGAIHHELGVLTKAIEGQSLLAEEARDEARAARVEAREEASETRRLMREELRAAREERKAELAALPCISHAASIAVTTERVDRLNNGVRTKPPTSPGMHAVTEDDLATRLENTERTVIARTGEQVESVIAARLQAGVEAVLDKRAAEAERAAEQRREQARREQEAKAEQIARDLAAKTEADKARWARVQWAAGLVATILGSGTVLSYCNTKASMEADRQAVVRALREQPAPVVVKVPTPVPVPAVKTEE